MTKGAPLGHLFLYAVPLLLGNWLQLAYNAVDSIIAGRFIGQDALAAEGVAGPVMNLVILAISGLCIGAGVLMSEAFGAKRTARLKETLATTLLFGAALCCAAAALGLPAVFQSLSLAGDSLGDAVFYQVFHLLLGGVTQDQDGHGDAAQAQLHSFVYAAHRQIIRAILLQHPRHLNGAVAIGICLHHAQELHAPSNVPAQLFVVFLQGVQVNNRPGPLQCRFHKLHNVRLFLFFIQ